MTHTREEWSLLSEEERGACVEWAKARNKQGYGEQWFRGKVWRAHRVAWVKANGEIPEELPQVLHHCDNPPCINVEHLFVGTVSDNMKDRSEKGRHNAATGEANGRSTHPDALDIEAHRDVCATKLDRAQAQEIKERFVRGTRWAPGNAKELALEFGVGAHHVRRIGAGARW